MSVNHDISRSYEANEEWLYEKAERTNRRPTDGQVDKFCSHVWDLVIHGVEISAARLMALRDLYE